MCVLCLLFLLLSEKKRENVLNTINMQLLERTLHIPIVQKHQTEASHLSSHKIHFAMDNPKIGLENMENWSWFVNNSAKVVKFFEADAAVENVKNRH